MKQRYYFTKQKNLSEGKYVLLFITCTQLLAPFDYYVKWNNLLFVLMLLQR